MASWCRSAHSELKTTRIVCRSRDVPDFSARVWWSSVLFSVHICLKRKQRGFLIRVFDRTPQPGVTSNSAAAFSRTALMLHFFPRKRTLRSVYERIPSVRYDKLNVFQRSNISFLGLWDLLTGLCDWIRAKFVLKINWSVRTLWHEYLAVARSGLWTPEYQSIPPLLH